MHATTKQAMGNETIRDAITRADSCKPPLLSGSEVFEFRAVGCPAEQGSMHAFVDHEGRQRMGHNDGTLAQWRKRVKNAAKLAMGLRGMLRQPQALLMGCEFVLPREGAMAHLPEPTFKRDEDKFTRAIRDALSLVVYEDDGQVLGACMPTSAGLVALPQFKRWVKAGERPGVIVRIRLCPEPIEGLAQHAKDQP